MWHYKGVSKVINFETWQKYTLSQSLTFVAIFFFPHAATFKEKASTQFSTGLATKRCVTADIFVIPMKRTVWKIYVYVKVLSLLKDIWIIHSLFINIQVNLSHTNLFSLCTKFHYGIMTFKRFLHSWALLWVESTGHRWVPLSEQWCATLMFPLM